jgi:endonuclease/exonuclease/phosphatase family metal-dependent hydrolase
MRFRPTKTVLFSGTIAFFITTILAQTSPWPFPSRSATPAGSWPFPSRSSTPAAPGTARSPSNILTVAFWNIEWFPGRGPEPANGAELSQTNAVHAEMSRIDADIIGMEEVRDFASAALAVQPLKGFKVDVCANFPPREGQAHAQEVAIASRLQPLSAWAEKWKSAGPLTPPRGFAFAAYQVAPRHLALVYAVHLKSNLGEVSEDIPVRQESIRQLRSHIDAMEKAYSGVGSITWIIGGDFNTSMDDPQFAQETSMRDLMAAGFSWGWQNAKPWERVTHPGGGKFPPASFDHVFFKNAGLRQSRALNTSPQASDHHAIVTTLELPAAK